MNSYSWEGFASFVNGLFVKRREGIEGFLHAAVGLSGESGEVLDKIKKHWAYDRPLLPEDREKLIEEGGDVLHYLQMLCIKLQCNLEDLRDNNIDKLNKRYPNGYSDAAAIARADQRPARSRPDEGRDAGAYGTDTGC